MASSTQTEQAPTALPCATSRRMHTRDEILAIFRAAREEVQAATPASRDLLEEFLAERHAVAACE